MSKEHQPQEAEPNLPARVKDARLPTSYHEAKRALAKCRKVDECKEWADKAGALKSYAYMSKNDELLNMSKRIQALAARRGGQLLKKFDGRPQNPKQSRAHRTLLNQKSVAEKAGLSKQQKDTFLRLANIPEEAFETAVESRPAPSLTTLASLGTRKRAPTKPAGKPADCRAAVELALTAMRAKKSQETEAHDSHDDSDQIPGGVEPNTRPRKGIVLAMARYPLEDLWWPKMLLEHVEADNASVLQSGYGDIADEGPRT
jgi:hypothetical protein